MFYDFFKLGIDHILDPNGFDHILFVTTLCVLYDTYQWKNTLILVTAFTIGHSLTLALSAMDIVRINPNLVETLIPITIILTAIFNIITVFNKQPRNQSIQINYLLALFFGLVHGLGFSNYFRAIMGRTQDIIKPLFAFNLGVEAGQIIIVACVTLLGFMLVNMAKIPKKYWTTTISMIAIGVSVWLLLN